MIELITQREFGHCGIACAAMVTKIPYEEILDLEIVKDDLHEHGGLTSPSLINILRKGGKTRVHETFNYLDESFAPERIFTVPSLNFPGLLHWVVWKDGKIFDPAKGKKYPEDCPEYFGGNKIYPASAIVWE